jgi:valyl-tRNA synthetase
MTELPRTFDPAEIEARWYSRWESEGLFRPARDEAEPWTIVMPPPNVTGSLHIGHALDVTLQDILTRHARLQGKDALWVVGTDHAGIATQMVVERQLNERQQKRTEFSREEFIAKVWEWKAKSGGAITDQLRRLGVSCDWARERFTMDEGFSGAVVKVFVDLYNRKLLYRDKRLVNWDPGLRTAISDLEVETTEINSSFWHFSYPLEDGSGAISVATTRPETMLADMAVAVHPEDARYAALVGKNIKQPITGRLIPIIADEHADPELGSGAVKITPGHDFNDFEVGKRAGFRPAEMLNMLDGEANVIQTADGLIPAELLGMDRFDARKRVVEMIDAEGLLEKVEDRVVATPFGDRSGVVIEPWLTDQWYVDAETLAKPAIAAVRDGDIRVVPETWKKTWFNWLENIQPWCVSRQLWWGHQIPAWYDDAGKAYVAETEEEARSEAGDGVALRRDPDVLDTWFSSALWPFATLGWPEQTEMLRRHYPNDVLISGFDIIFFWDARMAMMGYHFMGAKPWETLYLHGLVRDARGQKMSKSKGNSVDPIGLIDKYGADALRFTMAAMESQGRDIKLDEKRVEGYRNFATKLWNAARFCQANGIGASEELAPPPTSLGVNRWIIGEVVGTLEELNAAIEDFRFDAMADAIYQFTWGTFCDWYLEFIKPTLQQDAQACPEHAAETRLVAGWVLDQILVMLHPFMPFVTEELWSQVGNREQSPIIVASWPKPAAAVDAAAKAEMEWRIKLVGEVRGAKNEVGIAPGQRMRAFARGANEQTRNWMNGFWTGAQRIARLEFAQIDEAIPEGPSLQIVVDEATFILPLDGVIDIEVERARLITAAEAAEKERDSLAARLANPAFVERARPEAVEKARADHAEKSSDAEKYRAALARLG